MKNIKLSYLIFCVLLTGCTDKEVAKKQDFFEQKIYSNLKGMNLQPVIVTVPFSSLTNFKWYKVCFSRRGTHLKFFNKDKLVTFNLDRKIFYTKANYELGSVDEKCLSPNERIKLSGGYRKKSKVPVIKFEILNEVKK